MINSLSIYYDSGKRYAAAINDKDYSKARFENNWCNRAINMEKNEDKKLALAAYKKGYSSN